MSDIGAARRRLRAIAAELEAEGRADLAHRIEEIIGGLMHRRKPARKAPRHSQHVTPEVRDKIIELAATTELHSSEIAAELNVNPGRVSEVLQGDR